MATQTLNRHSPPDRPALPEVAAPIHVLLVDDHPAVRHGIRQLIAGEPDMVLIAEHGSASRDTSHVARWCVDSAVEPSVRTSSESEQANS